MFLFASLALVLAGAARSSAANPARLVADTIVAVNVAANPDSLPAPGTTVDNLTVGLIPGAPFDAPLDTVKPRPRPRAIEVSDWYYRRLQVHRWGSYTILPLFALEYVAGNRLFPDPANAPTWAKTGHRVGATLLAGVFTVNTVTGLWNLWDSRAVPDNRVLRYVHSLSMLAADGAFTYDGSVLAVQAENSLQKRQEHRAVAFSAMGVTMASALMMKFWNNGN